MSLSKNWSQQGQAVPPVYRLQRMFFAASIVLGTAAILVAASTNPPYYGSQQGIASAVATNATDSDLMDQTHLVAQLIAAYLLPLGFLTMAWLANRRAPWMLARMLSSTIARAGAAIRSLSIWLSGGIILG